MGATAAAAATTPLCTTALGCLAPVGLGGLALLSAFDSQQGWAQAVAAHQSAQGKRVLDSFDPTIHWGQQNALADLGIDAGIVAAEAALGHFGGKLLPTWSPKFERLPVQNRPIPIKFDGAFYSVDGFKISRNYYERLWDEGSPAPFLQAREILLSNPKVTPDPRGAPGYFRYEAAGIEMIYNPRTGQIGHIRPYGATDEH